MTVANVVVSRHRVSSLGESNFDAGVVEKGRECECDSVYHGISGFEHNAAKFSVSEREGPG